MAEELRPLTYAERKREERREKWEFAFGKERTMPLRENATPQEVHEYPKWVTDRQTGLRIIVHSREEEERRAEAPSPFPPSNEAPKQEAAKTELPQKKRRGAPFPFRTNAGYEEMKRAQDAAQ